MVRVAAMRSATAPEAQSAEIVSYLLRSGSALATAREPIHATVRAGVAAEGFEARFKTRVVTYPDDLLPRLGGASPRVLESLRSPLGGPRSVHALGRIRQRRGQFKSAFLHGMGQS